jgi:hypothetical protein
MKDLLNNATELSISEYSQLKNPIFKGQTDVKNNMYWMVFEEEDNLYKFQCPLSGFYVLDSI